MKRPLLSTTVYRRMRPMVSSLLLVALASCACAPDHRQGAAFARQQMQIDQNKAQLDLLQAQVRNLSMRQSSPSPAPRLCQISFQSGHATLNVHDLGKLRQLASELNRHPQLLLSINGYSDNVGDEGANTDLSQRRANSVEQALIDSGVAAGRLNTHAFGSENPAAGNTRAAGRHINRRVECVVRQTESAAAP